MQHEESISTSQPANAAPEFLDLDLGPLAQSQPAVELTLAGQRYFRLLTPTGVKVVSAACPHMGGEVEDIGPVLECPLHGWTFDKATGRSLNAPGAALAQLETIERNGHLFVRTFRQQNQNPAESIPLLAAPSDLSIRLVAHSCLEIKRDTFTLLTDPWLDGPAMLGAWTPYPPPATTPQNLHPNAIWISHEHSDHFHEPTLAHFKRNTAIYFPDFPNARIPRRLAALGFTNLHPMPFGSRQYLGSGIALTSYEPASLWNDAILLLEVDDFRLLNLNDAGLNRRIANLVGRVDAVASAFTPGASGYPLTWTHLTPERQTAILERSCRGMLEMLREATRLYGCTSLLPYAGHFALWHPVHQRYLPRMRKNSLADVTAALADLPVQVVDLLPGESWHPATRAIDHSSPHRTPTTPTTPDYHFNETTFTHHHNPAATLTPQALDTYFLHLNTVPEMIFCEDLLIEITATDLALQQTKFTRRYQIQKGSLSVAPDSTLTPNLTIRIPLTVLAPIVTEDLSWDESHIGYWCEFSRSPDVYHGGFWRLLQSPYYRRPAGPPPASLTTTITPHTSVGALVEHFGPPAERILGRYGMYCGGCHRASAETLAQAAATHGIDSTQSARLVAELNAAFGAPTHG